ncbi:MAG: hypothetical protein IJ180_04710 [Bacteroidales bacterium]|nr:hypothetical protein [Bacteroidales bacterium]
MKKTSKILVTIGVIILWIVLFAIVVGLRDSNGHSTPGIFGTILFIAMIAGIRAIWKSKE